MLQHNNLPSPNVLTSLENWQSARRFHAQTVPRETISELLEFAVRAPTCRLAQPWRFHVIGDITRQKLANLGFEIMTNHASEKAGLGSQKMLLEAPCLVAISVCYSNTNNPRRVDEDYAAVCCCIQNLNLAAHARGLSIWWRTGELVRDARTHQLLALECKEQLVGILTIGYAEHGVYANLQPASSKTRWLP